MNLVLLFPEDFVDTGRVELRGRRAHHIRTVHRAEVGRELCVGVCSGRVGTGVVSAISSDVVSLDVTLTREPPPPAPLSLVLALPRPKVCRRLVQTITTLGIKQIYLIRTWRVEQSFWQSPLIGEESLCEQMILGLEQARDTVMPTIAFKRRFRPFVEDELPALVNGARALMAHPRSGEECPRGIADPTWLAVGPEGGFIDEEIASLSSAGFCPVSLHERILRVEDVVTFLAGRLL